MNGPHGVKVAFGLNSSFIISRSTAEGGLGGTKVQSKWSLGQEKNVGTATQKHKDSNNLGTPPDISMNLSMVPKGLGASSGRRALSGSSTRGTAIFGKLVDGQKSY